MSLTEISNLLERAEAQAETDKETAVSSYGQIIQAYSEMKAQIPTEMQEELIKIQETAIMQLGKLFSDMSRADDLSKLIQLTRPFLPDVSKAKAAKLVRHLVDLFLDMEASTGTEISLCQECIEWSKAEKRTFLRQALESRLITLYFADGRYQDGLQLVSSLLKELKKMDDKLLLVEVQLMESKIYHSLSNLPRARAALTSARTTANAIYVPPKLQAGLDLQSGILHAADETDFKTAYSYFYEAFEGYDSINSNKAVLALKYMLMAKIMLNCAEEVPTILGTKLALRYSGPQTEAMRKIAQASHKRSLADFQQIVSEYKRELQDDPIIRTHLDTLYDKFLEQNLCRIIEPYSRVQIEHVSKLIDLSLDIVEKKLSQMILDKQLNGILDQGQGVLIVYDESTADKTYDDSLEIIHQMSHAVDQLYAKAKKIA